MTNIWKPTTIALIIQKMINFPTAGQLTRKNWLNNNTSILSGMPFTHLLMLYTIYMLKVAILSNPRTDSARNSSRRSSRIWSLNFSKLISQVSNWYTVWKNEKFSLTKEKFRQINSLVIYLVKPLLSRNFCQKYVRENFRNFHTVIWKHEKFSITLFWQKKLKGGWGIRLFTRNIFSNFSELRDFSHTTVWKLRKFSLT